MDLIPRIKSVVLDPKDEWGRIKGEQATPAGLFTSYAAILAAVPAIAQFIGYAMVGIRVPFANVYRFSPGASFARALISYIFSLVTVYLIALVIKILAPNFSSDPDLVGALKLAIYSMTPAWVAGILYIIPSLGILVMLASIYGLYLLYLGFDSGMLNTPKDKVMPFFLVSVVAIIVLSLIFGLLISAIFMAGAVRAVPAL